MKKPMFVRHALLLSLALTFADLSRSEAETAAPRYWTMPKLSPEIVAAHQFLIEVSRLAYDPTTIGLKLPPNTVLLKVSNDKQNDGFQAVAIQNTISKLTVIAFAGTNFLDRGDFLADVQLEYETLLGLPNDKPPDWKQNRLDALLKGFPGLKSSDGSGGKLDHHLRLADEFYLQVKGMQGVLPTNLVLTGHSLGGTEAALISGKYNVPSVTFGSPGIPTSTGFRHNVKSMGNWQSVHYNRYLDMIATRGKLPTKGMNIILPNISNKISVSGAVLNHVSALYRNSLLRGDQESWIQTFTTIDLSRRANEINEQNATNNNHVNKPPADQTIGKNGEDAGTTDAKQISTDQNTDASGGGTHKFNGSQVKVDQTTGPNNGGGVGQTIENHAPGGKSGGTQIRGGTGKTGKVDGGQPTANQATDNYKGKKTGNVGGGVGNKSTGGQSTVTKKRDAGTANVDVSGDGFTVKALLKEKKNAGGEKKEQNSTTSEKKKDNNNGANKKDNKQTDGFYTEEQWAAKQIAGYDDALRATLEQYLRDNPPDVDPPHPEVVGDEPSRNELAKEYQELIARLDPPDVDPWPPEFDSEDDVHIVVEFEVPPDVDPMDPNFEPVNVPPKEPPLKNDPVVLSKNVEATPDDMQSQVETPNADTSINVPNPATKQIPVGNKEGSDSGNHEAEQISGFLECSSDVNELRLSEGTLVPIVAIPQFFADTPNLSAYFAGLQVLPVEYTSDVEALVKINHVRTQNVPLIVIIANSNFSGNFFSNPTFDQLISDANAAGTEIILVGMTSGGVSVPVVLPNAGALAHAAFKESLGKVSSDRVLVWQLLNDNGFHADVRPIVRKLLEQYNEKYQSEPVIHEVNIYSPNPDGRGGNLGPKDVIVIEVSDSLFRSEKNTISMLMRQEKQFNPDIKFFRAADYGFTELTMVDEELLEQPFTKATTIEANLGRSVGLILRGMTSVDDGPEAESENLFNLNGPFCHVDTSNVLN